MSCCGKGQSLQSTVVENGVKARYIGQNVGAKAIHGNDERVYRGGNNRLDRIQYLHPDDVELLKDSFTVVEAPINSYSNAIILGEAVKDAGKAFAAIPFVNAEAFSVNETGVSDEQADQPRKRGTK